MLLEVPLAGRRVVAGRALHQRAFGLRHLMVHFVLIETIFEVGLVLALRTLVPFLTGMREFVVLETVFEVGLVLTL